MIFPKDANSERLAFILANREKLVEAWLAETGLLPSQCVLMQQDLGHTIRVWIEKRPEGLPSADEPAVGPPDD